MPSDNSPAFIASTSLSDQDSQRLASPPTTTPLSSIKPRVQTVMSSPTTTAVEMEELNPEDAVRRHLGSSCLIPIFSSLGVLVYNAAAYTAIHQCSLVPNVPSLQCNRLFGGGVSEGFGGTSEDSFAPNSGMWLIKFMHSSLLFFFSPMFLLVPRSSLRVFRHSEANIWGCLC